jgi:nitrogen fixation NifU-like protein
MDLYTENILDHFRHPRFAGELKAATVRHKEENLSCGDELTVDLKIENRKIKALAWHGTGCAISQAAMSMFGEKLEGIPVKKAQSLKPENVLKLLGVKIGPRRMKCALLSLHAVKNAIHKHRKEPAQSWTETIGN